MLDGKPLRTAKKNSSIWKDTSEDDFRRTVIRLVQATNGVPGDSKQWWSMSSLSEGSQSLHCSTDTRLLSSRIERRLADDIAFISAAQEGVESVAAVCVAESREPPGLIFRIAANEGIQEDIRDGLQRVCERLMFCAQTDSSLADCISTTREMVLELSHRRITSRMRLFLGYPPSHRRGETTTPGPELGNTLRRMRDNTSTPVANEFLNRLFELKARFESMLSSGKPLSARELEECVSTCFSITTCDGRVPFRKFLQEAGLTRRNWFNNKFIMQIDKLGAYHRISETLSREARRRRMRPLFSNIKLEYIRPYQPGLSNISLDNKNVRCHVHAEVQMVIQYILQRTPLPPRHIGSSKAACFLCHLFITKHNVFSVSAWHGRLYDQWTIPDLADYTSEDVSELRTIIQQMQRECSQLASTQRPRRRQYPLTSRHNLHDFPIFSPASTTLSLEHGRLPSQSKADFTTIDGLEASIHSGHAFQSLASPPTPEPVLNNWNPGIEGLTRLGHSCHPLSSEVVVESSENNDNISPEPSNDGTNHGLRRTSSSVSISAVRRLYLQPGSPRVIESQNVEFTAEAQPPCMGLLTLREGSEMSTERKTQVVNLEDLREGDEIELQRPDADADIVIRFQRGDATICCINLEWT